MSINTSATTTTTAAPDGVTTKKKKGESSNSIEQDPAIDDNAVPETFKWHLNVERWMKFLFWNSEGSEVG